MQQDKPAKVMALKPNPQRLWVHQGRVALDLGDNVYASVVVTTTPTDDKNNILGYVSVLLGTGKPPTEDDDKLLTGLDFRTNGQTQEEVLTNIQDFIVHKLDQRVNIISTV